MSYLKMINEEWKKTVVLVTHDPNVASYCQRVLFVKDGRIETELMKKGNADVFCDEIIEIQKRILKNESR